MVSRYTPQPIDRDLAERLVGEVQKRPVLYDASHPEYKDRSKVELEWSEVARVLEAPVDLVRKRWQNLRGSYSRSLASRNAPVGSSGKKPVRFYLEEQMSFLKYHMASTTGNYSNAKETFDNETQLFFKAEPNTDTNTYYAEGEDGCNMYHVPLLEEDALIPEDTYESDPRRRGTKRTHTNSPSVIDGAMLGFLEGKDSRRTTRPTDPDLDFLRGLLPQVKDLTPRNKRVYFKTITNILFDMIDKQEDEAVFDSSNLLKS